MELLIPDFSYRCEDLRAIDFPDWLVQPFLIPLVNADESIREELAHFQQDPSASCIWKYKGQLTWLSEEMEDKYPQMCRVAQELLLPFPTSHLVECCFSAVADLMCKKQNRLNISTRGDLRLKLTSIKPRIDRLCEKQQAHGSH